MPFTLFKTNFGTCGLAWNEIGLSSFSFPETDEAQLRQKFFGRAKTELSLAETPAWSQQLIESVQAHFDGQLQDYFDVSRLDWSLVSDFQRGVYEHTHAIKPGYKKSYGEIARLMGLGNESARAVGVALGSNPWPLIVPCHRVVSASDKMTGFSAPGGIRTKTRLLAIEGAELLSE
ncbi:methylated-DNA--[protein]-cysteine S-methyltransferase [Oleiharenicola lentus]|uniref:methylated-DNA--[protein]-cysteine S-methyltransferase n=1 Tax=Oleiharenicola lentus TaxID=2508720 RepID=UPI003F667028